MKATLIVLFLICATAALGQSSVGGAALSAEPQMFEITGHAQHASPRAMARPDDLRGMSEVIQARGERPLWEVAPRRISVPLGDVARFFRKQHETVKKADIVWEN
jgi:hypothetical protein